MYRDWGRLNAVLNLIVIVLVGIGTWLMWSDRTEQQEIRRELQRLNERIETHITETAETGAERTGRTAGGQDGL